MIESGDVISCFGGDHSVCLCGEVLISMLIGDGEVKFSPALCVVQDGPCKSVAEEAGVESARKLAQKLREAVCRRTGFPPRSEFFISYFSSFFPFLSFFRPLYNWCLGSCYFSNRPYPFICSFVLFSLPHFGHAHVISLPLFLCYSLPLCLSVFCLSLSVYLSVSPFLPVSFPLFDIFNNLFSFSPLVWGK